MTQREMLERLNAAQIVRQNAERKSDAWYDADAEIDRLIKALYKGKSIDIDLDAEVES